MYIPCKWIPNLPVLPSWQVQPVPMYRDPPFCTYTVHKGLYSLWMAVAYGQLSCGNLPFSCPDITQHSLTMYIRSHTRLYAFLEKSYRKADHMPQPFLGSTDLYEQCMYRRIPVHRHCLNLSWTWHEGCTGKFVVEITMSWERFHGMKEDEQGWTMYRQI